MHIIFGCVYQFSIVFHLNFFSVYIDLICRWIIDEATNCFKVNSSARKSIEMWHEESRSFHSIIQSIVSVNMCACYFSSIQEATEWQLLQPAFDVLMNVANFWIQFGFATALMLAFVVLRFWRLQIEVYSLWNFNQFAMNVSFISTQSLY